jgi:primosomal protein N' (replication factor Y)
VVLQVFDPQHYAVKDAAQQNYKSFFQTEMQYRRAAQEPPYTYLISLTTGGATEEEAEQTARLCMEGLSGPFRLIGVIHLPKRRDRCFCRILLKGKNLDAMRAAVRAMFASCPSLGRKDIRIDVNPMNLE